MRRRDPDTTSCIPAPRISAGSPSRYGRLVIIPVVRMVHWAPSPAYMASGEPLGLLLMEDGAMEMRIVSFTGTCSWWDDFCSAYPAFAGVVPQPPAGDDSRAGPSD